MINTAQPSGTWPEGAGELCLDQRFRKVRLRPDEASDYLAEAYGISATVGTLRTWRSRKSTGPEFQRDGQRVLYRRLALDEWAAARLGPERRSTSED